MNREEIRVGIVGPKVDISATTEFNAFQDVRPMTWQISSNSVIFE
jgi:hypothetical protein